MWDSRFFLSTRGKLLLLLKNRRCRTVADLSEQLALTRNAIRQHLSALERDNLVSQQWMKTGRSKPALAYSLTPQADALFPKQYARLLSDLLHELTTRSDDSDLNELLCSAGYTAASRNLRRLSSLAVPDRLKEVARIMGEGGAIVEWGQRGEDLIIRDFNCPYAEVVKEHPRVCQVQGHFLQCLLTPAQVDVACDPREARCEFLVRLPGPDPDTKMG